MEVSAAMADNYTQKEMTAQIMKDIDKFYENPQSFNFKELWDDTDGTSLSYLKDMFD